MKVSFDFDSTLDRKDVQEYAVELMERGIQVQVTTSRIQHRDFCPNFNDDLFRVTERLGIEKVIFTDHDDKVNFLGEDIIFHLDDDQLELYYINTKGLTKGICVWMSKTWREECEQVLNENK